MIAVDIYRPALWRDFFVMVGTGAASLTGLVFVAMTLNIKVITRDPTHRYRAIGTLSGLTASFMLCALVLMGSQNHQAVGAEMLVVFSISAAIYINGYVQASKSPKNVTTPSLYRTIGGSSCYLAEVVGAVILISGSIAGLYVAAVAIVANFYFMISGAWLLLVGVYQDEK
jgi:hypothetical membrane protein